MAQVQERPRQDEEDRFERTAKLLGGTRILKRKVKDGFDAHNLIVGGLPGKALTHLVDCLVVIKPSESLGKAVGISTRTLQRRKDDPDKPLDTERSGRTWKFAEILARATDVFGAQEEAEEWLEKPATGLNNEKPIDLLSTPAGLEMLESHLTRIEYGVYT